MRTTSRPRSSIAVVPGAYLSISITIDATRRAATKPIRT
jgi:hypothetical protein